MQCFFVCCFIHRMRLFAQNTQLMTKTIEMMVAKKARMARQKNENNRKNASNTNSDQ